MTTKAEAAIRAAGNLQEIERYLAALKANLDGADIQLSVTLAQMHGAVHNIRTQIATTVGREALEERQL